MKSIVIALSATIFLPVSHLFFNSSDVQWYVLTFNDRLISFLWCMAFFINCPKKNINVRSILAVSAIFTACLVYYYVLWLNSGINDIYVYPVTMAFSVFMFLATSIKNYDIKSDRIIDGNVYICFWRPENSRTIFPSLLGSAVGSVSIYAGGTLYGFKWRTDNFKKEQRSPKVIEKKFVVVDTGVKFNQQIGRELKKLNAEHACIGKIRFLRFKCIYSIRNVLNAIGREFSPGFFEYIPALYAKKILRLRNG